ncbi:MAG: hypothetical protein E6L09_03505 [Verrucomicrobia bacterium]|nr:MAG: hypothetical protein E6L09_03505 [Verrucomicrobiota bacterium]
MEVGQASRLPLGRLAPASFTGETPAKAAGTAAPLLTGPGSYGSWSRRPHDKKESPFPADRCSHNSPMNYSICHTRLPSSVGLSLVLLAGCATAVSAQPPSIERVGDMVIARAGASQPLFVYHLKPPADTALPVESGGFFHPLTTPRGLVVTDFAPTDHKHHRGVFLAWVEMHGAKDADFWGWGERAPVKDRRIINQNLSLRARGLGFRADNQWRAEDAVLLTERLDALAAPAADANALDLVYTLTPKSDLTLTRWAFSGFCVRVRKDGELACHSTQGLVTLPNPNHLQPESDWPDAPWYAFSVKIADGWPIGVAVFNHSANPPTLWHNHRDVRMLNPCIVAPEEVKLKAGQSLTLRYRVVTFDGPVPTARLNRMADEWRATR